ncbi:glycosyltransferase family 4 protein [Arenibacter sp. BSSL-BM3]|uniref:Glycosyltransferase family 4 protein n=1 Tax=Arenibacter arenosicollis TaxID=2762274 RepID=A0ABR7QKZ3_9FLAO|nr:glycosyltransferase family 4 protein [Arenibacter arenosicollis]MBC8767860.1 glycosyltransferase family 4 protein [Arenibacter arenosicollis]
MKILFLLSRIEKSGVTLNTLDLAQGLVDQGHQLLMITGGITDGDNDYLVKIENDFKNIGTEIRTFNTPKGNILSKILTSIVAIYQILKWIQELKPDIIHSQSPYMTFLPWLLNRPFITTVHNVQLVKNLKYKNPTELIAISRESKEYAIKTLGAKPDRVSVICHGVSRRFAEITPEKELSLLKNKYNIPGNKIVIGFVGRITKEKGLDVLITAVEKYIPKITADNVHLVFLGDYWFESDKIWLKEIIDSSVLRNSISIVPFQDPKPFYELFQIFVLPSKSEAFGLVSIEAMMSNCCTIRTDTNGALDQIDDGKDGYIFANGNAIELAEILLNVIENKELRETIAANGKFKALENFTIEAMTKKTLSIYNKMI